MDKYAFLEGYLNRGSDYVKKSQVSNAVTDFMQDPKVRLASYAPQALGVAGAGIGAYLGNKASRYMADTQEEEDNPGSMGLFTGALAGGALGSLLGNAIKNRVKWNRLRKVINQL